jgi:hypothetical protein
MSAVAEMKLRVLRQLRRGPVPVRDVRGDAGLIDTMIGEGLIHRGPGPAGRGIMMSMKAKGLLLLADDREMAR